MQLPLDVACQSPAVRNMLGAGRIVSPSAARRRSLFTGAFRESLEGRIVFPTIRAEILQEVVDFLLRTWRKEAYRPRLRAAGRLIDLALAAHYLELPLLVICAARAIAATFAGNAIPQPVATLTVPAS